MWGDSRNLLLCVVQISSSFAGGFHSLGEIDARTFEAALCQGLQFGELTLFGVELARSGDVSVAILTTATRSAAIALNSGQWRGEP
jgi:hypothetical protein